MNTPSPLIDVNPTMYLRAGTTIHKTRADIRATARVRRLIRAMTGASPNVPIAVELGADAPSMTGARGRYTTQGGRPVTYPNAYRRAWGKPVYHCSTMRVTVGREWLREAVRAALILESRRGRKDDR